MLIVESRGMPPSHPQQAGHGLLGHFHEPRRGPDATAFPQMADDILGFGLRELGMEQGGATALGEFLSAGPTAQ